MGHSEAPNPLFGAAALSAACPLRLSAGGGLLEDLQDFYASCSRTPTREKSLGHSWIAWPMRFAIYLNG
jgi:hypothetical protein